MLFPRTTFLASVATAVSLLAVSTPAAAQSVSGHVSVSAGVHIGLPQIRVQVGTPAPPPVVYVNPAPPVYYAPAPVYYAPAPTYYARPSGYQLEGRSLGATQNWRDENRSEWGLTGRLSGGAFGGNRSHYSNGYSYSESASVGGIGVGLRLRPIPHIAIEGNIDAYAGQDTLGRSRAEAAVSANLIGYLNPRSVLQVYGLIGIGTGHSSAGSSCYSSFGYQTGSVPGCDGGGEYNFVGGQIGAGLELRIARGFALNADVRGFVRSSDGDNGRPEYVAPDGHATNTSGGVLTTLGATIYFR